jgi:hypothetical protein
MKQSENEHRATLPLDRRVERALQELTPRAQEMLRRAFRIGSGQRMSRESGISRCRACGPELNAALRMLRVHAVWQSREFAADRVRARRRT